MATLGTFVVSKLVAKQYESRAQVQLQPETESALLSPNQSAENNLAQSLAAAQLTLRTQRLATQAAQRLNPPPRHPDSLLDDIKVTVDADAGFVIIQGRDSDPRRAAAIANAFAQSLIDVRAARRSGLVDRAIAQLNEQLAILPKGDIRDRRDITGEIERLRGVRAGQGFLDQVVQPALVRKTPVSPRPARNAAIAFLLSSLLAVGLVFLLERIDRRLRDSDDVAALTGVAVLAEIPPSAVSGGDLASAVPEAYQRLWASLAYFDIDRPVRSVVVTGALQGEGKTTVARNLAMAAALAGKDVILVDTDLRLPAARGRSATGGGLAELLVGNGDLAAAIEEDRVGEGRLRILPSGGPAPNPAALLGSDAMRDLVARLTADADLVVLDTAPLLVVSDPIPLLEQASGVILVARLGWTTRDALRETRKLISNTRGSLLGTAVTNAERFSGSEYGGYIRGESASNGQVDLRAGAARARRWLRDLSARR